MKWKLRLPVMNLRAWSIPSFALEGGDTKDREYKNGNVTVTVRGNSLGLATVFDKDIWIYAISKLQTGYF